MIGCSINVHYYYYYCPGNFFLIFLDLGLFFVTVKFLVTFENMFKVSLFSEFTLLLFTPHLFIFQ